MGTLKSPISLGEASNADDPWQSGSWAHVSGWALLSGTRRTISCIVPCKNQARILASLLPALSDTLTECGYPWEVIVVDYDSQDGTQQELALWTELHGFRCLRCHADAQTTLGVALGLRDARGDAVLFIDPDSPDAPELIPGMVLRWESGAKLVCVMRDSPQHRGWLLHWDEASLRQRSIGNGLTLPAQTTTFSLLDRWLVEQLVRRP